MTDKPRNKWFWGDGTLRKAEHLAGCIVLCRHEARCIRSVSARYGYWLCDREYAIVPINDLNLDTEEPDLVDEFRRLLEATRYIQDCDRHYDTYRALCADNEQRGVLFEMTRERQDAIRRGRG